MRRWKRLFRDETILTVAGLILFFWFAGSCTLVTGLTYARRKGLVPASPRDIEDVWVLPLIVTVVWTPVLIWRVWKVLK